MLLRITRNLRTEVRVFSEVSTDSEAFQVVVIVFLAEVQVRNMTSQISQISSPNAFTVGSWDTGWQTVQSNPIGVDVVKRKGTIRQKIVVSSRRQ